MGCGLVARGQVLSPGRMGFLVVVRIVVFVFGPIRMSRCPVDRVHGARDRQAREHPPDTGTVQGHQYRGRTPRSGRGGKQPLRHRNPRGPRRNRSRNRLPRSLIEPSRARCRYRGGMRWPRGRPRRGATGSRRRGARHRRYRNRRDERRYRIGGYSRGTRRSPHRRGTHGGHGRFGGRHGSSPGRCHRIGSGRGGLFGRGRGFGSRGAGRIRGRIGRWCGCVGHGFPPSGVRDRSGDAVCGRSTDGNG